MKTSELLSHLGISRDRLYYLRRRMKCLTCVRGVGERLWSEAEVSELKWLDASVPKVPRRGRRK